MKTIKFLIAYTVATLYRPGEIATFADDVADDLIEREIAALHSDKAAKPAAAEKAAAEKAAADKAAKK